MPVKSDREYRSIVLNPMEDNEYVVEGNFSTYDSPYKLYDYDEAGYHFEVWEQVRKGAFDNTDLNDVIMQYDHEGRVFARSSNGTLQLDLDEQPHMRANLGGTEIGRQLYEEIKGGYTNKMSFGFIVDSDEKTRSEELIDGVMNIRINRTITGIKKLFDVSCVSIPANDQTSISARSFSAGVVEDALKEIKEVQKNKNEEARKRLALKMKMEV